MAYVTIVLDNGLAPVRRPNIYLKQWWHKSVRHMAKFISGANLQYQPKAVSSYNGLASN